MKEKPELDENAPDVPAGDFVAIKSNMHYVSVDPSGKLGWKSNTLTYVDTTAHVIEVLTEKAGNAYKSFLRKLGISYIIAGTDDLNYEVAMEKLKELFGIETLMLGGGGVLNCKTPRLKMEAVYGCAIRFAQRKERKKDEKENADCILFYIKRQYQTNC